MNKAQAQESAIELARTEVRSTAVVFSEDGQMWNYATWSEPRYLDVCGVAPGDAEIWFCKMYADNIEWECYQSAAEVLQKNVEFFEAWESGDIESAVMVLRKWRKEY